MGKGQLKLFESQTYELRKALALHAQVSYLEGVNEVGFGDKEAGDACPPSTSSNVLETNPGSDVSMPSVVPVRAPACGTMSIGADRRFS